MKTPKPPKTKKPAQRELVTTIVSLLAARDSGKALYAEADLLLKELLPHIKVGERIDLGTGEMAELVDNFADGKNIAWRPCGVRRFEIQASRAAKKPAKPLLEEKESSAVPQA